MHSDFNLPVILYMATKSQISKIDAATDIQAIVSGESLGIIHAGHTHLQNAAHRTHTIISNDKYNRSRFHESSQAMPTYRSYFD